MYLAIAVAAAWGFLAGFPIHECYAQFLFDCQHIYSQFCWHCGHTASKLRRHERRCGLHSAKHIIQQFKKKAKGKEKKKE